MSRLIHGEECARVYSYLGLDRAWRNAGAGAGFSLGRFDPRHIPGIAALYCANTAAFPTAVVFPDVMPADWNMEAVGTAAWTAGGGSALSKQAGDLSGTGGAQVLRITGSGWASCAPTKATVGNTFDIDIWARGDTGTGVPRVRQGSGAVLWTGTASAMPQHCVLAGVVADSASTPLLDNAGGAGTYAEFDDLRITTRNASQLSDLSGNGRHLVQATPANQPLWVASGAGGVLRADGATDSMATAAFARPMPRHMFVLCKWNTKAAWTVILDSTGSVNGSLVRAPGADTPIRSYNGVTALMGPAATSGAWHIIEVYQNAANSGIAVDGGAYTTGPLDAGDDNGLKLCVDNTGTLFASADVAAVVDYTGVQSAANAKRVVRWMLRQKAMLGL